MKCLCDRFLDGDKLGELKDFFDNSGFTDCDRCRGLKTMNKVQAYTLGKSFQKIHRWFAIPILILAFIVSTYHSGLGSSWGQIPAMAFNLWAAFKFIPSRIKPLPERDEMILEMLQEDK